MSGLKDLFWKEPDALEETPAPLPVAPKATPLPSPRRVPSQFAETIAQELERDAKARGFNEFIAHYKALQMIPDEQQRASAALATLLASDPSLNANAVVAAIRERSGLLASYDQSYQIECQKTEQVEKDSKTAARADLERALAQIQVEIEKLRAEQSTKQTECDRLTQAIAGIGQKYNDFRTQFEQAVAEQRAAMDRILSLIEGKDKHV